MSIQVGDKVRIIKDHKVYTLDFLKEGNIGTVVEITTYFGKPGAGLSIPAGGEHALSIFGTGWNFPQSSLEVVE